MDHTTHLQATMHAPASRRMHWFALVARVLLWLTVIAWLLFGASWSAIHGWIVPRIGDFRPGLEMQATRVLGMPVRIGQISASSDGFMPSFELRDVVLFDLQGREALRFPRLLAALSPASLWKLGFEQLSIDRPVLEIRRALDGKLYVGGLEVSRERRDGGALADWIFSQAELSIQGGTVRWVDELRALPPVALTQVDAVLRNGPRSHRMRLDATPPAEWGGRFSLRGVFGQPLLTADAGRWRDWSGELYAAFDQVDLSRLKPYADLGTLGIDLRKGSGGLRAWADVRKGEIVGGTADVALTEVDVQLGQALEPLVLTSVTGRFGGTRFVDGFEFNTQRLLFATHDGLQWPGGNLALTHTQPAGSGDQKNELKGDRLDLAALAQIANRLPLDSGTHAALASYAPKGLVETLEARWQLPASGALTYFARGRVRDLEVASLADSSAARRPGRPGVRGANLDFEVTHSGGKAALSMAHGALDFPGVFEETSIPFDTLALDAQWKIADGKIDTQLRNIRFSSPDAEGFAQASWRSGPAVASKPGQKAPASLGVLDLQGSLSRGNGAQVHRYLPLVLPERVRHYVRDAVVDGDISDVKFKVKGPVDNLPFSDPSLGEFSVSARVKNGTLVYVPKSLQPKDALPWPALTGVRGELVFNRASLSIKDASATVAGLPGLQLAKADAHIPDLLHLATLQLNGSLKGPVSAALGFVNTSPVAAMTGQAFSQALASGSADYSFRLSLPLHALDKAQIQGTVNLPGNDVQFSPSAPLMTRLRGVATFSESGFNVTSAQARLLGGDIRFEGGTRLPPRSNAGALVESGIAFRAQGTVTAEGIRQAKDLGLASLLGDSATGTAAYTATLGWRRNRAEVMVSSNLQGMALSLPAPLTKAADAALPVRFENTLLRESLLPGQKLRDQVSLVVGRVASVLYVRDVSGEQPQVLRGAIGVGVEASEALALPDNGVMANINLATVDIDAWAKALSGPPATVPAVAVAAAPAPARALPDAWMAYLPSQLAVRAKELRLEGHRLNNVVAGGTRDGLDWRANVDAAELNGYVEFRQPGGAGAGRLYARLSRLSLGASSAGEVESILDEPATSIPALDIVVEDLELRGKKLGRVEIDAVNRGAQAVLRDGGVREWRLNKFNITLPEAVLTATGNWVALDAQSPSPGAASLAGQRPAPERRRTGMNFRLDIADSGELLKRFGMAGVIRRGKGKMEGRVAWIGSPLSLDYPTLGGQFNVNMESGQFLKADPGIAKLLGVLSLQSLPRRLTLDFRDVFSEGFAFDFVRGDISISQGLASTNNLQMKGVNAAVLMEGKADIARETQDIKVVVVPEINAGTASLIATVINPAIGLGSFLAQYFLRQPLIQATTQEFHVDGSWADPKISKVDRKP